MCGAQRPGPEPSTASRDTGLRGKGLTAPRGAVPWVLLLGLPTAGRRPGPWGPSGRQRPGSTLLSLDASQTLFSSSAAPRPPSRTGLTGDSRPGHWWRQLAAMTVTACEPGLAFWERERLVLSEAEGCPVPPRSLVDGRAVAQSLRPHWGAPQPHCPGLPGAHGANGPRGSTADTHLHPHRALSSAKRTLTLGETLVLF